MNTHKAKALVCLNDKNMLLWSIDEICINSLE